ncbi:MAG: hypothetical protein M3R13_07565 [Armatimonadota bacterium]|nr:hypothetical protein [Armatimonadota bacterium]
MRYYKALAVVWVCASSVIVGAQSAEDVVKALRFRNIGPAVMSGRISDIDCDPKNTSTVYVATASGGVWKSTSDGTAWTPIFDAQPVASIGAVQVSDADSKVVWVGSGESNNRNSSAWGNGVYLSTDAGETWKNVGLEGTQQIARIVTDPKDPKRAWVAAMGALWNANEDRGIYLTEDSGATWKKVLYIDENTGCTEIVVDPKNPKVLYAGMYERRRWPWTFRSGGKTGGVFKSTDGGKKWAKLAGGLPKGDTGKIGLAVSYQNSRTVYAQVEGSREEDGTYRSDDGGKNWKKRGRFNSRPFYYYEIAVDPFDDNHLLATNTQLTETTDGGTTWRNKRMPIHVDYHAIWFSTGDKNHIWVGEDGGAATTRDGDGWRWAGGITVAQFYAVAADMAMPYHVYGGLQDNGSWGSPSMSRIRQGIGNWEWYRVGGGDGFHVQVDPTDNVTLYSESQGGAIGRRNKRTGDQASIRPRAPQGETYRFNWSSPIVMSPHNSSTIWFGGNRLFKSVDKGTNWRVASPDLTTNDADKNKPMEGLTPENTGAERHCTIITISESPRKVGVVWVGTDDGNVQLSEDDGYNWTNVTTNFTGVPKNTWVSRVEASRFKLERAYATFDGHRAGDYKTYVYTTEDFGKTWTNITANLPSNDAAYVIKEDPTNENLLYVGTEFGLYVSLDRGKAWTRWNTGLPTVAVHDLVIHPREREIIIATHGRGIWIAPVEPLQQATSELTAKDVDVFVPITAVNWASDPSGGYGDGAGWYYGSNPPLGARLAYWLKADATDLAVEILDASGRVVSSIEDPGKAKGANVVYWNLRARPQGGGGGGGGGRGGGGGGGQFGGGALPSGSYAVRVTADGKTASRAFSVIADPILGRE